MTDDLELARRAIACDGWRWMHRMVDTEGITYLGVYDTVHLFAGCERESWRDTLDGTLPDLTDDATIGCVLALVREAWGDPLAHVAPTFEGGTHTGYRCWLSRYLTLWFEGDTERAALVAALEAAPVGGAS